MSQTTASTKKSIIAFRVAPYVKDLVTQVALSEGLAPSEWLRNLLIGEFKRRNLLPKTVTTPKSSLALEKFKEHGRVSVARRRDKFEIFADILQAALDGARTTEIIYRVNLNSKRFREYSEYLVKAGFLEVLEKPGGFKIYKTTGRGRIFLEALSR
ncbi:MAG: winged helix-turn-helix domain-containing protein [Candidatus Bathyarchaeia archaeon]